jgi:hypothetical protein
MIIKKIIFQMIGRIQILSLLALYFESVILTHVSFLEVIFQQKRKDIQKIFGIHFLHPTFIWNSNWHIATTTPNNKYIA